jgi:hypothetical protein
MAANREPRSTTDAPMEGSPGFFPALYSFRRLLLPETTDPGATRTEPGPCRGGGPIGDAPRRE